MHFLPHFIFCSVICFHRKDVSVSIPIANGILENGNELKPEQEPCDTAVPDFGLLPTPPAPCVLSPHEEGATSASTDSPKDAIDATVESTPDITTETSVSENSLPTEIPQSDQQMLLGNDSPQPMETDQNWVPVEDSMDRPLEFSSTTVWPVTRGDCSASSSASDSSLDVTREEIDKPTASAEVDTEEPTSTTLEPSLVGESAAKV